MNWLEYKLLRLWWHYSAAWNWVDEYMALQRGDKLSAADFLVRRCECERKLMMLDLNWRCR